MSTSLKMMIVSAAFLLFGVCGARAESYRVDYAVKAQTGEARGSVTCRYDQRCTVDLNTLQMRLAISILRDYRGRADLVLDGDNGCCLFDAATRRRSVDPRQPSWHLRLFTGEAARGLEYIENEPIGVLYLKFDLGEFDHLDSPLLQHAPI